MSEKKRKYLGKRIPETLEVIRVVDKSVRLTSEIAQVYGMPLVTLLMNLRNRDTAEQQAVQGSSVSKQIRICDAKWGDTENELFEWFCSAQYCSGWSKSRREG
jgi:hypothetical protein